MFAVEVRDHIMIAHSLPAEVFGPAQGLHGATYVVDAAFLVSDLDQHGLVVDIGIATEILGEALAPLRYRNLDDDAAFRGQFTTTEFLARHIFDALALMLRDGRLGDGGRVARMRVTLREGPGARAWYEADL